ncbi:MAG: hypothetical protein HY400_01695 [Elusimicrobia bacterium]|nr:hypothetical protein [Elusimicrobiota bacterium]
MEEIEKIIRDYGRTLELLNHPKTSSGNMFMPISALPYPKMLIRKVLQTMIASPSVDEEWKEKLKVGLVLLEDFVDDDLIPDDPIEAGANYQGIKKQHLDRHPEESE